MAITTQMRTDVANLYVSLFGRAPERDGLGFWVNQLDAGKTVAQIAQDMYNTDPARATYPTFLTNEEIVTKFYTNVLGRTPDAEGKAFWTNKLNAGASKGALIAEMISAVQSYSGTDAAALASKNLLANKVAVSLYYAVDLGGNDVAKASLVLSGVTDAAASVQAAKDAATTSAGSTFTLTTGADTISGTAGNDAITADNTGTAKQLTVSDTINGGSGTDTLKVYLAATDATITLPTLTGIENLAFNGGILTSLDVSKVAGLTSLTLDSAAYSVDLTGATGTAAVNATKTLTLAGQAVTLSNFKANAINAGTTTNPTTLTVQLASTTDTVENVTLNAVTSGSHTVGGTAYTDSVVLDVAGAKVTAVNLTTTGAASAITLTNSAASAPVATVNIAGDKNLTLTESLVNVKTINASTATGNVVVDTTAGTANAALAFTGGSGNDTLKLAAGALVSTQTLDGGAGTDTLAIGDASISAALAKSINAVKGFDVLAFNGGAAVSADVSLVTGITTFDVSAAITGAAGTAVTTGTGTINGNAGTAAATFSNEGNTQSFVIDAALTGGAGGAVSASATTNNAGAGAAALKINPLIDNGSNAVSVTLSGITLTGGAGGAASSATTNNHGNGGAAVDLSAFETVTLVSNANAAGTVTTNTFTGGAAGGAGATAGVGLIVGTNATINVSGAAALNAGTITGTNVTVNAGSLTGNLTLATGSGNDAIVGGSGVNTITLNGGIDTVDLTKSAAKADIVTLTSASSTDATSGKFVTVSGFANALNTGDKLDVLGTGSVAASGTATVNTGTTTAATATIGSTGIVTFTAVGSAATFANQLDAAFRALGTTANKEAAFQFGSDTYVIQAADTDGVYTAGTDLVVKVVGMTGVTALSDTASAATTIWAV